MECIYFFYVKISSWEFELVEYAIISKFNFCSWFSYGKLGVRQICAASKHYSRAPGKYRNNFLFIYLPVFSSDCDGNPCFFFIERKKVWFPYFSKHVVIIFIFKKMLENYKSLSKIKINLISQLNSEGLCKFEYCALDNKWN